MTSENPDAAGEPAGRRRMRGTSFGGLILTSGPISPNGLSFDFRTACRTHDHGYDLLRHLKMGGGRRRALDLFFLEDLTGLCTAGPDDHEVQCLRAAKLA